MNNSNNNTPSLLAEALDFPPLDRHTCTSSSTASTYISSAANDQDQFHDSNEKRMNRNVNDMVVVSGPGKNNGGVNGVVIDDDGGDRNHEDDATSSNIFLNKPLTENSNITSSSLSYSHEHSSLSLCSSGANSSGANTNNSTNTNNSLIDGLISQHSDFTVPTSNFLMNRIRKNKGSFNSSTDEELQPPLVIPYSNADQTDNQTTEEGGRGRGIIPQRRSILGSTVVKKYHFNDDDRRRMSSVSQSSFCRSSSTEHNNNVRMPTTTMAMATTIDYNSMLYPIPPASAVAMASTVTSTTTSNSSSQQHNQQREQQYQESSHNQRSSRMIPNILPVEEYPSYHFEAENVSGEILEDLYHDDCRNNTINNNSDSDKNLHQHQHHGPHSLKDTGDNAADVAAAANSSNDLQESVHLQSLLLGLAFMVIWLPNNAMAPNLTQMANFFGMNETERDLYLGSYCALALGVFSLPLSGLIGFMADFYSRKYLFLACIILGALSSAWSGWAPNYLNLFLARLCSGGCMSGSVSVAFSMLGDLFSKEERNAASSGLTSMMGLGIILGQIYAGEVGPSRSWQYPFYASAFFQLIAAVMIALCVSEPIRGGKEHALQEMFKAGKKYEQRLTLDGFFHAMHKNTSNLILLWQGFLTSLPWGIIFVFLNDYLSQEEGFSVQQATFLVMLFGVGCAIGGITGGYIGQFFMKGNRSHLPIFMAVATFLGIFPFVALLNSKFLHHNGYRAKLYSVLGGCIASFPSVNIRPCIINVNPPETRGAALTAANLLVTLGRGMGPSCIVLLGSIFHVSRQMSLNITLAVFWTVSGIQLLFLAKTLPNDQDAMEEKLMQYAAAAQDGDSNDTLADEEKDNYKLNGSTMMTPVTANSETTNLLSNKTPDRRIYAHDDEDFIPSSPEYMFDGEAARQSLRFVKLGIQELGDEISHRNQYCRGCETGSPSDSNNEINNNNNMNSEMMDTSIISDDLPISEEEIQRRRNVWVRQQQIQSQREQN